MAKVKARANDEKIQQQEASDWKCRQKCRRFLFGLRSHGVCRLTMSAAKPGQRQPQHRVTFIRLWLARLVKPIHVVDL
jgi:hypothetical protein